MTENEITKLVKKVARAAPGLQSRQGNRFYYPRHGFGQISDAYYQAAKKAGAKFQFETTVSEIDLTRGRVSSFAASPKRSVRR